MMQPCKKDCPRRKERCFMFCPEWKQYEAERRERRRIKERDYEANAYLERSRLKNSQISVGKKHRRD